jgi:Spy/CpxP family protein refolding chaperone
MTRSRTLRVTLACCLTALFSTTSLQFAQQPHVPGGAASRSRSAMTFNHIVLSDSQRQQITAIFGKYSPEANALRAQMKPLTEQIAAARQANDTTKVQALRAQMRPLTARARALRAREIAEIRPVLTQAQQQQLDQNIGRTTRTVPRSTGNELPVALSAMGGALALVGLAFWLRYRGAQQRTHALRNLHCSRASRINPDKSP